MHITFSKDCTMPSSAMLTTHRFIYTVVGTPTDLVTWKGSGGS